MRLKQVYNYRLQRDVQIIGWIYFGMIAGIVVLPLLIKLSLHDHQVFSLAPYLANNSFKNGMLFGFFGMAALVYSDFATLIQNGISRRTYWWGKLASLTSLAVGVSIINVVYRLLVAQPLGFMTYQQQALKDFGPHASQGIVSVMWYWGSDLTDLIAMIGFGMLFGSILGLFSRKGKIILFSAAPFVGMGLVWFIFSSAGGTNQSFVGTWMASLLRLALGFDGHFQYRMPLNWIVTNLIGAVVMLGISTVFNKLLRVRQV